MILLISTIFVLAIFAMWRLMLRRTILDHNRDALFDLRDDLRAEFIAKGWDIGSPLYGSLRMMINRYLRYTEEYSFIQFAYLSTKLHSHTKDDTRIYSAIKAAQERTFATNVPGQQEYVTELRNKALRVTLRYMMASSGPFFILALLATPLVATCLTVRLFYRSCSTGVGLLTSRIRCFQQAAAKVIDDSFIAVGSRIFARDDVEELVFVQFSSKLSTA